MRQWKVTNHQKVAVVAVAVAVAKVVVVLEQIVSGQNNGIKQLRKHLLRKHLLRNPLLQKQPRKHPLYPQGKLPTAKH
jgi:hypothetical protein